MLGHMEWQSKHSYNYISKSAYATCDSEAFSQWESKKYFMNLSSTSNHEASYLAEF
jgi:hypothetical protein